MKRSLAAPLLALIISGCTSAPPVVESPAFDAVAVVAAIRATGEAGQELVISPLGDTEVADLREQAAGYERAGAHAEAAAALDQALAISPADPALLQERAEIALLQHDPATAVELAQRAVAAGSRVGPLCRRHWETIAQARTVQAGNAKASTTQPPGTQAAVAGAPPATASVEDARRQRDACTVAAPNRY